MLGGSYPEDHPILTTPSLFTDVSISCGRPYWVPLMTLQSPTYEDMLLLASILGPAKPPVATHEDVASAPGVYRVGQVGNGLVAERVDGEKMQLGPDERCLICLCGYEAQEDIRQLGKCEHVYHRDCIDEVNLEMGAFSAALS